MKLFKIGDIAVEKWQEGSGKDTINHYYTECDCKHCVMGWDDMSYEGECEDCGCCFDYHFNVPKWKCALPRWIKKLIKKVKGWD